MLRYNQTPRLPEQNTTVDQLKIFRDVDDALARRLRDRRATGTDAYDSMKVLFDQVDKDPNLLELIHRTIKQAEQKERRAAERPRLFTRVQGAADSVLVSGGADISPSRWPSEAGIE